MDREGQELRHRGGDYRRRRKDRRYYTGDSDCCYKKRSTAGYKKEKEKSSLCDYYHCRHLFLHYSSPSLSYVLTSTLPFVAQQLHAVASYVDFSQLQRVYKYSQQVQRTYNYSREIYSWGRDYYNMMAVAATTTPTTAATGPPVVVDVEAGTTTVSSMTPSLQAPTNKPLKDAESIHDYMSQDIIQKHMSFEYKMPSPMMVAYYNTFKHLVPFGDTTSKHFDEAFMEILQSVSSPQV